MAASDCVVNITVDSELGQLLAEIVPLCKSMEQEIERQRQEIAELRDRMESWAGYTHRRIQRLESLPGVAEAIAASEPDLLKAWVDKYRVE